MKVIRIGGGFMYVCLCMGVTSQAIEECCEKGAQTVSDLVAQTGAGLGCGCCKSYLSKHLTDRKNLAAGSSSILSFLPNGPVVT